MSEQNHCNRRLSNEELEFVKQQIIESIYAEIGKNVLRKVFWVIGALVLAAYAWLKTKSINLIGA